MKKMINWANIYLSINLYLEILTFFIHWEWKMINSQLMKRFDHINEHFVKHDVLLIEQSFHLIYLLFESFEFTIEDWIKLYHCFFNLFQLFSNHSKFCFLIPSLMFRFLLIMIKKLISLVNNFINIQNLIMKIDYLSNKNFKMF